LKTARDIAPLDTDKDGCLGDYFTSVFIYENKDTIPVILPSIYPDMPAFKVTVPGIHSLLSVRIRYQNIAWSG